MILFPLTVAILTVVAGLLAAFALRRLPTLRLQVIGLGLVAAALPFGAILLSGFVMLKPDYHFPVIAIALGSAASALAAAIMLGRPILMATERLRAASTTFASGDLSTRAAVLGPAELADVASSFNEMADHLTSLFDARRELIAWASHDLRTPLANMQAMLEAIEDGLAAPADYLPALGEQVRALSTLVDDLFELAQIDSGALTLELREAELSGLVGGALRGVQAEARARKVTLESHVDGMLVARCAPEKVERVLQNLLANALRHTPSDGSVAVLAEPEEGGVRVTVEDTGDGLPAESLRRMFERFWRGDPARSARGAGLGLAIARGIVEAHGGRIWAENRPGGGARVSFTLPSL
jgi:signal transduction histidine kinase